MDARRSIPAVGRLIADPAFRGLLREHARERIVRALREEIAEFRRSGGKGPAPAGDAAGADGAVDWAGRVGRRIEREDRPTLRPLLNLTGVVLHTNLGRAPLAAEAIEAVARVAAGYSTLEFDPESGRRGSRGVHAASALRILTGAPASLVVNNGSGALLLAVHALAKGRSVLVSRGELVEIGGSFRLPEVVEAAGGRLIEVGTTNRTRAEDYARAIDGTDTAMILRVHRSNFVQRGFVEDPDLPALAAVARRRRIPLVVDSGSGLLDGVEGGEWPSEERPRSLVRQGADVVLFSGDKLLGGPQAGIAIGADRWIGRMRRSPLHRALRVDRMTLAALEATLALHLRGPEGRQRIPALRALARTPAELREAATRIRSGLGAAGVHATVVPVRGSPGGGTLPGIRLPGWAVALGPEGAGSAPLRLAAQLRAGDPPVVGRVVRDRLLLDPRALPPDHEALLVQRVCESWFQRSDGVEAE